MYVCVRFMTFHHHYQSINLIRELDAFHVDLERATIIRRKKIIEVFLVLWFILEEIYSQPKHPNGNEAGGTKRTCNCWIDCILRDFCTYIATSRENWQCRSRCENAFREEIYRNVKICWNFFRSVLFFVSAGTAISDQEKVKQKMIEFNEWFLFVLLKKNETRKKRVTNDKW